MSYALCVLAGALIGILIAALCTAASRTPRWQLHDRDHGPYNVGNCCDWSDLL